MAVRGRGHKTFATIRPDGGSQGKKGEDRRGWKKQEEEEEEEDGGSESESEQMRRGSIRLSVMEEQTLHICRCRHICSVGVCVCVCSQTANISSNRGPHDGGEVTDLSGRTERMRRADTTTG